jgi:hypothetical protein
MMPRAKVRCIDARSAAAFALLLIAFVSSAAPLAAQEIAAPPPVLAPAEMEALLLNGRIIARKGQAKKGVTDAYRVTLSDGQTTHDAQVQNIDVFHTVFEAGAGATEFNFRDTYRYNIAAFRLARLLGLSNVPMSVARTVEGKPAAMTWWIDDVAMDESARAKLAPSQRTGPNPSRTSAYVHIMRVFDELIQNRDRNAGNVLWTKDWTMWLIDHTRAFRTDRRLLRAELLERCERSLCDALRRLTRETLTEAVGNTLLKVEIDAVLMRRDLILKRFDGMVAQRGEAAVLYTLPQ